MRTRLVSLAANEGMITPGRNGRETGKTKILIKCRFIKYVTSDTASFSLQSETMRIYASNRTRPVAMSHSKSIAKTSGGDVFNN